MGPRKRSRPNPDNEATSKNADDAKKEVTVESRDSEAMTRTEVKESNTSDTGSIGKPPSTHNWYSGGTWPRIPKSTASTKVDRETILANKSNAPRFSPNLLDRFDSKKIENAKLSDSSTTSMDLGKSQRTVDTSPLVPADNFSNKVSSGNEIFAEQSSANLKKQEEEHAGIKSNEEKQAEPTSRWFEWLRYSRAEQSTLDRDSTAPNIDDPQSPSATAKSHEEQHSDTQMKDVLHDAQARVFPPASWLGRWASVQSRHSSSDCPEEQQIDTTPVPDIPAQSTQPQPALGSGWAFWSREPSKVSQKDGTNEERGELAVVGESSEHEPAPAHVEPLKKETASIKSSKRGRPPSLELPDDVQNSTRTDSPSKQPPASISQVSSAVISNLLLPPLDGTFPLQENPSIMQQITHLLTYSQRTATRHVSLTKDRPKIRKALAIGVHGMFPAAFLRTVIGQPTGTSIRFANHAATALQRWAAKHGLDCEIEKVALEGDGKITERVDNLWKLLLNWVDHIRKADLIFIACHSQGVPVSVMLVEKLIEFGVVTSAKIAICAMAGVSLGPFTDYNSRLLSGSAAELFDFANSESEISKRYEKSLRAALTYGAHITYVGSIDDQLVPLESAVFSPANHPYIYRAVFIDGRIHAPDFIVHLVGFALKLRNLGVSDHGLIKELSPALAGSLYTGEGHSKLYDETNIYDLTLSFGLETTSIDGVPLSVRKYQPSTSTNPFQLPWSMRGLLEEERVRTDLKQEVSDLLQRFEDWKPSTKVLKDVKYRLEAIRSKL